MNDAVIIAVFVVLFLAGVCVLGLGAFMWAKAITGAHNATMNAKQASDFVAPAYVDEGEPEKPEPRRGGLGTRTRMGDLSDDDLAAVYEDEEDEIVAARRAQHEVELGKVRTMDENSGYDDERPAKQVVRG